ncbi:hypothetical protein PGT21_025832 [Puccinia graminis f. sp. tritici]|uniref:Uncharacterized protein n=1 Tax=Puccinia graminis f. sp. tritici TaxID=56615 RepID=A0A5B0PIY4_PUCGR|nr:hypothetical protein PGT21_025832 [Puccinia graminis f. sp. tritici]
MDLVDTIKNLCNSLGQYPYIDLIRAWIWNLQSDCKNTSIATISMRSLDLKISETNWQGLAPEVLGILIVILELRLLIEHFKNSL